MLADSQLQIPRIPKRIERSSSIHLIRQITERPISTDDH